jgi:glutathione synthase/RimK-type ligase-like ATP-grasp enzyme
MSLKVAIATALHELPQSDRILIAALVRTGCDARPAIWSDPAEAWNEFDAVIVRSCWDYHLRVREFLTWIANLERDGVTVLNSPNLIRWNHDKMYLMELAAKGVPIPETIFVAPEDDLDLADACASRRWTTAVVKPRISASAWRTERRNSGVICGPVLVQEYVAAVENEGEWSLIYIDNRFSHSVIKKPRRGDFRVQREFGGSVQEAQPPDMVVKFADSVLEKLDSRILFARVDLIASQQDVWLMELELIEPELFLDIVPEAAEHLARSIAVRLSRQTYRPFRKRQIWSDLLFEKRGWQLKIYFVMCEDQPPMRARFAAGIDFVLDQLPAPDPLAGRPGVGFLILHAGRDADYTVLCWWDRENELPIRIAVREQQDTAPWRAAGPSEGICIWDLEIIAAERNAYVSTMLAGEVVIVGIPKYLRSRFS